MPGESGFLLVFLAPLLLLLLAFLLGSVKVAWSTQETVALQSRLDLCAVRLVEGRKSLLESLVKTNRALRLTVLGIYASRSVKAAGPAGAVLGGASEATLLRLNHSLSLAQDAELRLAGAVETRRLRCEGTRFSARVPARCAPFPPLALALRREKTLFPDVKGILVHRQPASRNLARFRCWGGSRAAALKISGSGRLATGGFRDTYVE